MDLSFFPKHIYEALKKCDLNYVIEIRLRRDFNIKLKNNYGYMYLSSEGVTLLKDNAIVCRNEDIKAIIENVTEHSLYAFNDNIKSGFLTTKDGIRIGIAGQCVFDKNKILTIKNFSSLNIRIPNEKEGCSDKLYRYVFDSHFYNTLIVAPPAYGKTTILKDLIRKVDKFYNVSTLVIDERGEFCHLQCENVDIISYSDKEYAFNCGIRSLAPELIIVDELGGKVDWQCIKNATKSGVKVVASCHGATINDVITKKCFIKDVFERYVVLQHNGQPGLIDAVYDKDFNII